MTNTLANKNEMIKNMSIGFLPIIIYIIADALFGLTIGLIVAIASGIIEMAIIYYREGKVEFFIIADIGLLVLLGLISLSIHNDIFIKIKPALINIIMLILLFLTGFTSNSFLISMTARRVKGLEMQPRQISAMKKISRAFFFVFLVHTMLILYAAFYLSTAAWGFISGGLFYILAGGVMAYEWVNMRVKYKHQKRQMENEEWFDVVNPNGQVIGTAPRSAVHGNPDLLHPVVHLHLFNHKNAIFLQKRAMHKQVQPGKWDTSVGGHVNRGENIEAAILRETDEELGVQNVSVKPLIKYIWKTDFEAELVHVFRAMHNPNDPPIQVNPDEITEGRFWKKSEIAANLGKNLFTPNFEHEYLLLRKLRLL